MRAGLLFCFLVGRLGTVASIRPYVTCVGCETFLQCFLTCPVSHYPGINRQDEILS